MKYILLYLTVLFLGGRSLAYFFPPYIKHFSEKFIDYNPQVHNVIFLGASNYYRTINPKVVDEYAKANGCNISSFNFSIPNMSIKDYDFVIDYIKKHSQVKTTFFIYPFVNFDNNEFSYQSILTLDWDAFTFEWSQSPTLADKIKLIKRFLKHNLGHGYSASHWFASQSSIGSYPVGQMGWWALDDQFGRNFKRHTKFLEEKSLEEFRLKVENYNHSDLSQKPNDILRNMTYLDLDKISYKLLLPYNFSIGNEHFLKTQLDDSLVLSPNSDRDLYDVEYWYDHSHPNRGGARLISQRIGESICTPLKKNKN